MKKYYVNLTVAITRLEQADVITSSVMGEDNVGLTNGNWEGYFA